MRSRSLVPLRITLFLLAHACVAGAESRVEMALFLGASKTFNSNLEVAQSGQPTLDFAASFESRSFEFPLYYAIRLAWRAPTFGVELQLVHHKVYLAQPPPEIEQFEITHGFNLLTVNYVLPFRSVDLRFGLGVVVAHPESVVRGLVWSGKNGIFGADYHLTGPAFVGGAGRAFSIGSRFAVMTEVFLSAARARVPIAQGEAALFNVAFHVTLGVGFRF